MGIVEAPADATIDQTTFYTDAVNRELEKVPETEQTFQITMPGQRVQRHGAQALGRAETHRVPDRAGSAGQVNNIPGIRTTDGHAAGAARRRAISRWNSSCPPPPSRSRSWRSPSRCSRWPPPTACSPSRRSLTPRLTSRKWSWCLTATRWPRWVWTWQTVGADLAALVGGNYVNRFNFAGRSYKVIPQLKRVERLNAGAVGKQLRQGAERPARAGEHLCARSRRKPRPRSLNRFQQLNAVKISGVAIRPLDEALEIPGNRGGQDSARRATGWITPANRASCARRATSSCPPSCWRWC